MINLDRFRSLYRLHCIRFVTRSKGMLAACWISARPADLLAFARSLTSGERWLYPQNSGMNAPTERRYGLAGRTGCLLQLVPRRPAPISNLRLIHTFRMGVVQALDDLAFEAFLEMGAGFLQAWDPVDDVDCQVETIDLILDRQF